MPNVTGDWTGTWWPLVPIPQAVACKRLDCSVAHSAAAWQATFDAQCDQAYTFAITMEGRQAGEAVLFRGATDLGAQGGVFDWIGRATETEFMGFFTSSHYVGQFRLERTR
jgi:hypothetical protein